MIRGVERGKEKGGEERTIEGVGTKKVNFLWKCHHGPFMIINFRNKTGKQLLTFSLRVMC